MSSLICGGKRTPKFIEKEIRFAVTRDGGSVQFSSVAQAGSTLCDPHGRQHARPPCPSSTPGVCSNSCPSSWWYQLTISSSVIPCFFCLQSFLAFSGFFSSESVLPIRWPKYWSFSLSISPSNEYAGSISFRIDRVDFLNRYNLPITYLTTLPNSRDFCKNRNLQPVSEILISWI